MTALSCGNKKAVSLLADLEQKAGLIERKRQAVNYRRLSIAENFQSGRLRFCTLSYLDT